MPQPTMDFDAVLREKQARLEALRKQRLSKQRELSAQLSKDDEVEEKEDNNNDNDIEENSTESHTDTHTFPPVPPLHLEIDKKLPQFDIDIDAEELHKSKHETFVAELRNDLERQIRDELETKYRNDYIKALQDLERDQKLQNKSLSSSQEKIQINVRKLLSPKTKVIKLTPIPGADKILSLHEDYICQWTLNVKSNKYTLSNQWETLTTMNAAIAASKDNDKIIAGSKMGYVYIHSLKNQTTDISNIQLNPIVDIFETSNTIITLSISGEYSIFANNLIDVITRETNVFTSLDFQIDKSEQLELQQLQKHNHLRVTSSLFLNANNVVISLFTGKTYLVDLALKKTTLLFKSLSSLPPASLSFDSGRLLILGLDHSLNVVNLSTFTTIIKPYYLQDLTFCAEWLSSSTILTCSVNNQFDIWKIKHDKLVREKNIRQEPDQEQEQEQEQPSDLPIISKMKILDNSDVIVGNTAGEVYKVSISSL